MKLCQQTVLKVNVLQKLCQIATKLSQKGPVSSFFSRENPNKTKKRKLFFWLVRNKNGAVS